MVQTLLIGHKGAIGRCKMLLSPTGLLQLLGSLGLLSFNRCTIIRSCAKLHWEGGETLWVGAGMTEHEEQRMNRGEWLSRKTRVQWAELQYLLYIKKSAWEPAGGRNTL